MTLNGANCCPMALKSVADAPSTRPLIGLLRPNHLQVIMSTAIAIIVIQQVE